MCRSVGHVMVVLLVVLVCVSFGVGGRPGLARDVGGDVCCSLGLGIDLGLGIRLGLGLGLGLGLDLCLCLSWSSSMSLSW